MRIGDESRVPAAARSNRRRSLRLEQPNAHLYETGGLRRTHLRGHANIAKPLLVHTAAFNLGLLMRRALGVGTPRGLQGRAILALAHLLALWTALVTVVGRWSAPARTPAAPLTHKWRLELLPVVLEEPALTTGC